MDNESKSREEQIALFRHGLSLLHLRPVGGRAGRYGSACHRFCARASSTPTWGAPRASVGCGGRRVR